MKNLLLLFALTGIFSCNQKGTKKANETKISEEITKESLTTNDLENSEIFKMLQGSWVNNLDPLSTLTFNGKSVTNAYQDTLSVRTVGFVLGNSCLNAPSISNEKEADLYITTTGNMSECYFIKKLNDTILKINFVDGNIDLTFNKKR
ncbi:hypothetical protein ULMS_11060 [Patiriisocius marinistellae]|uniref:DUF306 domain-containing protein n=1 Tax=Patiriisocius marinistellae TaxID=2494560 RepID=A0A5J4FWG2_9FLAO|nr:hypothetical protein [Patiriisocius marinistellae]GEQ85598.1 hypothetical protein ULMS_11060 [Patiriisocius marinistellae]